MVKRPAWRIIGSTATYHWFPDTRVPLDLDILSPVKCVAPGVVDAQWHDAAQFLIDVNKDPVFLDPDLLFTIKVSHAHWNIKWEKTMFDIQTFKDRGCKLQMEAYHKLFDVWTMVHGKKKVHMKRKMTEFFNDAVKRIYDHEMLHVLVAFHDQPMHERLREDHSTAFCSEELFTHLSDDDKIKTVLEEMMAVAIERCQLHSGSSMIDKLRAMHKAYFLLVTSMTTGWFARFLILNRKALLIEWRTEWMNRLNLALKNLPN